MNAVASIKASMKVPDMLVQAYLGDLTDADLLARPTPDSNHIAWQLGHLIKSEHGMIEAILPGSMPELPEGFADRYSKETAKSDSADDFHTKEEYLKLFAEQRAGTLAALEKLSDEDLEKPAPEDFRQIATNFAEMFLMQPTHWTMHSGQWAVIRRKLGKPPLF